MVKFCPKCGHRQEFEDPLYCPECGFNFSKSIDDSKKEFEKEDKNPELVIENDFSDSNNVKEPEFIIENNFSDNNNVKKPFKLNKFSKICIILLVIIWIFIAVIYSGIIYQEDILNQDLKDTSDNIDIKDFSDSDSDSSVTPYFLSKQRENPSFTEYESNKKIIQEIAEEYHSKHTYSYADFFVCSDMALDVWNMVETAGINAQIVIGDVSRSDETLFESNHAWVIAETSENTWTAIEATGGYIVENNDEYYYGWFFENSKDFKKCMSLFEQYNSQLKDIKKSEDIYNLKVSEYNSQLNYYNNLVSSYNTLYANKHLTNSQYQASLILQNTLVQEAAILAKINGEYSQASVNLENEYYKLNDITDKINLLV